MLYGHIGTLWDARYLPLIISPGQFESEANELPIFQDSGGYYVFPVCAFNSYNLHTTKLRRKSKRQFYKTLAMKTFVSNSAPKPYSETTQTVMGTDGWAIIGEGDISSFPTKNLYVQILCADDDGEYVWSNVEFQEAMQIPEFAAVLRCVRAVSHGYNTTAYGTLLYSEEKMFQITQYLYRTQDRHGKWHGGFTISDFEVVRGVVDDSKHDYYGDDEKPGF